MKQYDFIIVGSGIAGLYTALLATERGSVLVITKGSIDDCNTKFAQGGIAAAIGRNDSPELHYRDTVTAGDGLCDDEAVRILASEASDRIAELVDLGVPFDTQEGEIALSREAAHSAPRILHAGGDATGEHIEMTLSSRVNASGIEVLEHSLATEIIVERKTVKGIRALDCRNNSILEFGCRRLVMATGGVGQLFKFNTNSEVATGDGVALAYSAGAEITDMEFYQFHPTALYIPGVTPFLITEAVRGEGGILRNAKGYAFMTDYTPDGDLAPRDVVARSILYEMQKTGSDNVFLDVTHFPSRRITTRFPQVYRFCLEQGLDITSNQIPVAPAAHYMMGGIRTNSWGQTSIAGLAACGETACVAVHGANRLASNSLLEAVVFSKRIIQQDSLSAEQGVLSPARDMAVYRSFDDRPVLDDTPPPDLSVLQNLLWDNVGMIRNRQGLTRAANTLASWQHMLPVSVDRPSYELSNLVLVGRLMAEAALIREESRGAHFRSDFPQSSPQWQHHVIFTR